MPRLVCLTCGRTLWATLPAAQLFAEERRCARCGTSQVDDRRAYDQRVAFRRQDPHGVSPTGEERRTGERRLRQRRKSS